MDLRESREKLAGSRHPWELARLQVVYTLLNTHLQGRQPHVILDLGCGDAFVANQLSRRYPETRIVAVDVELDDETLAVLGGRLSGQRISLYKTLTDAAAQSGAADVVLLLDVIEHVSDDVAFLNELRASPLVTPQTVFLLTAPAHQGLFCSHDVFLGHYRRYDNSLLSDHLSRAGYVTDTAGYFFFCALLFRLVQVRKERWIGRRSPTAGLADWRGGPLATAAVSWILQMDFTCSRILRRLGIRLPGLSNYALCKMSVS